MVGKILVLQPDEINYSLLNEHLNSLSYTNENIYRCNSLLEAVAFSPKDIEIILADLSQSSRSFSSAIRELKIHFIDNPVIILTDDNDAENYLLAIREGAEDLLVTGSYNYEQLGRSIAIAIERNNIALRTKKASREYEEYFDNGPIPVWMIDDKTMRFLIVNNAAVEKYGYSKEEFSKMSILDIVPKDDTESILEYYYQQNVDNYDAGYWRHVKKDGDIFYVHVYTHRTIVGANEARLCFSVDVNAKLKTDQRNKELNALLKEQKEQLDSILSSISDAVWSRKADNNELLYGNKAYYQLYGFRPDKLMPGRNQEMDNIYPDDRETFLEAIKDVRKHGKAEIIYRYINEDGSLKTLKANAVYKKGAKGKADTVDGVTVDITQEKEFYDAIRNSEQKLLSTINNTRDLIWSVDRDLKIIFCNKVFQEFFYNHFRVALDTGDYVLGNWHSESFIKKRAGEYARTLNGESISTVVEEIIDGNTHYYEITSCPITDIDEKIVGVNCVSRDITEQKNQVNKIERQNAMLKEIAGVQAHEVHDQVVNILNLLSKVDRKAAVNKQNIDLFDKILAGTMALDDLIKEIVDKTKELDHVHVSEALRHT